jgi:hypothetical protein
MAMIAKFEKYWKKSSIVLAVNNIFDPRYKRRLIEFHMNFFYGER